ncbi:hypothetical protein [Pseudogemmobacter humi]|uniref:hypothetical protein n=1 Tax=Pseudogemmobacter humi TaxID=2483812 RepID=UPI000F52BC61|nr:hypothetical protein [Pseudogemmobacter humi]
MSAQLPNRAARKELRPVITASLRSEYGGNAGVETAGGCDFRPAAPGIAAYCGWDGLLVINLFIFVKIYRPRPATKCDMLLAL